MMKKKYNHLKIEQKWQAFWKDQNTFKATIDHSKPKYYILDMFPYPSGAGLHVGHVTGYTATDILARYKRQKGFNVLHPMGWDSFGLQAEQYAIRTGTHPKETTKNNIKTYKRQLESLGFSYDWDRELATSDPKYYKWTQWIFTKLYEKGLAYEAEISVNYCPHLGTVLANEEVESGKSIEGGYPVERRPLRQWVLKITEYAERLLKDLDLLDWPDYLKRLQKNWIGKSEGVQVTFLEEKTRLPITAFTTRPDTLFGVTFLVLSPEHPLTEKITSTEQKEKVKAYTKQAAAKSDLERSELSKEETGVWSGSFALCPVRAVPIPIWIADYVLISYGTGAVMGVPGADERDFEFSQTYDLPVIPIYDPNIEKELSTVSDDLDPQSLRSEILEGKRCWTKGGKGINGKSKHLDINGCSREEAAKQVSDYLEEKQLGKRCTSYKLRDWLFSRQRYWGEPFPILHFEDGSKRFLNLDELPLTLPDLSDYKPAGEGQTPLDSAKSWVNIIDKVNGKKARRETNTMPQWAGSCWYYLRFCDPHNEKNAWDSKAEKYWMPVDLYIGGVEHAVLHLLYARFWHKVLYDLGCVSTIEPFQSLRNQGLVTSYSYQLKEGGYVSPDDVTACGKTFTYNGKTLSAQVEKMSKSKLNGVSPDDIVKEFGADALRLYEMFMGPFDKEKVWDSQAISGCRRFLDRFYSLVFSDKVEEKEIKEGMRLAHLLVYGVEKDIEALFFNTAIAKMMEFINAFSKLPFYPKAALIMATQALAPFAPHLAEECWEHLTGKSTGLSYEPFPAVDKTLFQDEKVTYIIQVNGKLRGRIEQDKGIAENELLAQVKKDPSISKYLEGEIIKVIYIPNKLLNIVVKKSA